MVRHTSSPVIPLCRKRKSLSGDTMNGGLDTMRSNVSPATGSNRSPSRHSTPSSPFSWALNAARATARALRSVATTRSLCWAARKAWNPEPVPRSRAERFGRRTVRPARVSELALMPIT